MFTELFVPLHTQNIKLERNGKKDCFCNRWALPGFHDIDTVGHKFAELINDGQTHQGEFIELYPIVKED